MAQVKQGTLLVLAGPTAVGKTAVAIQLCKAFGGVVVNFDSRQLYYEMQIISARPIESEWEGILHFGMGSHSVLQPVSAGAYLQQFRPLISLLLKAFPLVVLVGGSGLYVKALLDGLDKMPVIPTPVREAVNHELKLLGLDTLLEELKEKDPIFYAQVDRHNHARVSRSVEVIRATGQPFSAFRGKNADPLPFPAIKWALDLPRAELYSRIDQRVHQMIANGMEAEAKRLLPWASLSALQTVGMREWIPYFEGKTSLNDAVASIQQHTRNFAKRQLTWFRNQDQYQWWPPTQLVDMIDTLEELGLART